MKNPYKSIKIIFLEFFILFQNEKKRKKEREREREREREKEIRKSNSHKNLPLAGLYRSIATKPSPPDPATSCKKYKYRSMMNIIDRFPEKMTPKDRLKFRSLLLLQSYSLPFSCPLYSHFLPNLLSPPSPKDLLFGRTIPSKDPLPSPWNQIPF